MNKTELIKAVATATEMTNKAAGEVVEAVFETITNELAEGNEVSIFGFGKFSTSVRAAREGRNPSTGETIQIDETTVPKFSAAKALKLAVK